LKERYIIMPTTAPTTFEELMSWPEFQQKISELGDHWIPVGETTTKGAICLSSSGFVLVKKDKPIQQIADHWELLVLLVANSIEQEKAIVKYLVGAIS
jgi:hypothetical protein